ncbi:hypothetical protein COCVIDRAFT_12185 [Bipolaris victoriae FI3]|uniref:Inner kinetochore subunit AME1 domain-containing protein n=1 Tax=Bipolaris victoriae (strain FI3) TaxID=930091 RepID=W7ETV9_BIPV3|nr:hypothetical protein COCVIDRAFT_12185 [Bipolaris victoriae FI3]
MAPVDRREHRQQRVRGAGPSSVQATFGFSFGALGAAPAKQSSLPPLPPSRRTPVQSTPRAPNGSAQRHRSASLQRSSASKRKSTPKEKIATPRLGKRKRASPAAQSDIVEGEDDELSPNREEIARSVEKIKRVVGTVSPVREEQDNGPDELSVLDESASNVREAVFARSTVMKRTPPQAAIQQRALSGSARQKTPTTGANETTSAKSRRSISRRSKSTDPVPETPSLLPSGQPRKSASRIDAYLNTPAAAPAEDESEDELSPQVPVATPRVVGSGVQPQQTPQEGTEMTVDELSPQLQPMSNQKIPTTSQPVETPVANEDPGEQVMESQPVKRGRGRPRLSDGHHTESNTPTVASAKSVKRTSPREESNVRESEPQETPAIRKSVKKKNKEPITKVADETVDDLSPARGKAGARQRDSVEVSSVHEASAGEGDSALEEEAEPTPQPVSKRSAPEQAPRVKPSTENPPRKRQKLVGPTHTISVMRIKGSTVRGVTAADITRSILEDNIDHRLKRMAEKLQNLQDSDSRKELRSQINMSITFKESLNEKLMDLQDANDVLSTNFQKMKLLRRANADLRKEMLGLQNSRQEIAMEQDDIQTQYHAEKARVDAQNTLSDNMFAIEAAIKNGRAKARKEGRENEGPEMPLSMLLDGVAKDVGSRGGGLLANVKGFNGLLKQAASWLEGRA